VEKCKSVGVEVWKMPVLLFSVFDCFSLLCDFVELAGIEPDQLS